MAFQSNGKNGHVILDTKLSDALTLFVIAIILELIQYAFIVVVNEIFLCEYLKRRNMPDCVSWFSWVLWSIKIVLMTIAYILIGSFLWS